jgi:hypothetical protein
MSDTPLDPDEYVRDNRETLIRIVKHSNDEFVRALCLAAIVEYGDEPSVDDIQNDLDRLEEFDN